MGKNFIFILIDDLNITYSSPMNIEMKWSLLHTFRLYMYVYMYTFGGGGYWYFQGSFWERILFPACKNNTFTPQHTTCVCI